MTPVRQFYDGVGSEVSKIRNLLPVPSPGEDPLEQHGLGNAAERDRTAEEGSDNDPDSWLFHHVLLCARVRARSGLPWNVAGPIRSVQAMVVVTSMLPCTAFE